ncbi:MAG: hypothetical protein AB1757_28250 [Acidobacteriota bacterium]
MMKNKIFIWLMPSIGDVLFLRILFNILTVGTALLYDGDTGWHLITGENILKTWQIPFHDPYSHTLPETAWTAHEWLAEVIFAFIHRWMGLNGVVIFSAILIALTYFLLYRFLLFRKVSPMIAVFFTAIGAWASSLHWLARPHIFSFLFTLAFFIILELHQREGINYLKFLPVLMLVWVNLHGGYIFGLMLVGIYLGGNLIIALTISERREAAKKSCKSLAMIFGITLLATFCNPQGPAILYFPFHLIGRQFIMDNVAEWLSPNFHKHGVFEFVLLFYLGILIFSKRKPGLIESLLVLLLVHMSLYSARYIPLLGLIVTPMAAIRFTEVFDGLINYVTSVKLIGELREIFLKISANITSLETRFNKHLWIWVGILGCLAIALNGGKLGGKQLWAFQHDKSRFPVEAMEFVLQNEIPGRMFNNDSWGGYIIYKSYPNYKVFMDGRSDMYGVPLLKEYVKVATAQLGYEEVLDKYDISWVMFNANSPICQLLIASGKWKLVYADTTANILLKDTPKNQGLIIQHKDVVFLPKDDKD